MEFNTQINNEAVVTSAHLREIEDGLTTIASSTNSPLEIIDNDYSGPIKKVNIKNIQDAILSLEGVFEGNCTPVTNSCVCQAVNNICQSCQSTNTCTCQTNTNCFGFQCAVSQCACQGQCFECQCNCSSCSGY